MNISIPKQLFFNEKTPNIKQSLIFSMKPQQILTNQLLGKYFKTICSMKLTQMIIRNKILPK